MQQKAIAIIQARCSSKRLPGKVLFPIQGKALIHHIYERASICKNVSKVIIATSLEDSDDVLASYCKENNLLLYRGDLKNVLSRFISILKDCTEKYFVRITGDSPLISPEFIDHQIKVLDKFDADFIMLEEPSTLMEGQGVQSIHSLLKISQETNHPYDLEHVGSKFISENLSHFRILQMRIPKEYCSNKLKITIDEFEDFSLINELYKDLYKGQPISFCDAVTWLRSKKEDSLSNSKVSESAINIKIKSKLHSSNPKFIAKISWKGD